jgi:hypothetical protein
VHEGPRAAGARLAETVSQTPHSISPNTAYCLHTSDVGTLHAFRRAGRKSKTNKTRRAEHNATIARARQRSVERHADIRARTVARRGLDCQRIG